MKWFFVVWFVYVRLDKGLELIYFREEWCELGNGVSVLFFVMLFDNEICWFVGVRGCLYFFFKWKRCLGILL